MKPLKEFMNESLKDTLNKVQDVLSNALFEAKNANDVDMFFATIGEAIENQLAGMEMNNQKDSDVFKKLEEYWNKYKLARWV
jgi:hypothetical protein